MSELEQEAAALEGRSPEQLMLEVLRLRIRLAAAHEQIGGLKAELEQERRVKR